MEAFYNFLGYFYSYPPNVSVEKKIPQNISDEIKNFNSSKLRKTVVKPPTNFYDNELKRLLDKKFKRALSE